MEYQINTTLLDVFNIKATLVLIMIDHQMHKINLKGKICLSLKVLIMIYIWK